MKQKNNINIFYLLGRARELVLKAEKNLGEIRIEHIRRFLRLAASYLYVVEDILSSEEQ